MMDLTGMLREGSLTDLRWYREGMKVPGEVTFDPVEYGSKNPNDTKPEAQDQWGYGDISPIFDEPVAGVVDRQLREEDLGDAAPVIIFARHMMNQGAPAQTVDRELKARFAKEDMKRCASGLKELFSMDGLIGRIAVDARGYENCAQAMAAADKSPYKGFIKFVIGCSCGDPHMIPVEGQATEMVASSGNPTDDFFADDSVHQVKEIPHCPATMLPLFSSVGDIDPTWQDSTLTVVENVSGHPGDESKAIRKEKSDSAKEKDPKKSSKMKMLDEQPIQKIQAYFRELDRQAAQESRMRYSEPVDASEHMLDTAENEIELFAEVQPDMEIDAAAGDFLGNEVPSLLSEVAEVDMTIDSQGTIFEGSDEIELDAITQPEMDLEMDMNDSEMTW